MGGIVLWAMAPGYLCSKEGTVWLLHFMLNLNIYIYIYIYIQILEGESTKKETVQGENGDENLKEN